MTSLCTFDSPDLTRIVNGNAPTFVVQPSNANSISVTGSFTNGGMYHVPLLEDNVLIHYSGKCLFLSNRQWPACLEHHHTLSGWAEQSNNDMLWWLHNSYFQRSAQPRQWNDGVYSVFLPQYDLESDVDWTLYTRVC